MAFPGIHLHRHKANQFCVLAGDLAVNRFDDSNRITHCEAIPMGCSYVVMPPERHQFVARSLVEAYEVYWVTDDTLMDPVDIERFSTNGVDEQWIKRNIGAGYVCCCQCSRQFRMPELVTVCMDNALRDMCYDCLGKSDIEPFKIGGG